MEETYGCNLINTKHDGRQVKEFVGKYHVHVLVRQGEHARFITGTDLLIDGGVIASIRTGEYKLG